MTPAISMEFSAPISMEIGHARNPDRVVLAT